MLSKLLRALVLGLLVGVPGMAVAEDVVTGVALYRERIAMPPGVVFEAILEDVSHADAPATVLGRTVVQDAGQPPYAFEIAFDPARIDPASRYSVRARLSAGGRLHFATDAIAPVLTGGAPAHVDLVMVGGHGAAAPGRGEPGHRVARVPEDVAEAEAEAGTDATEAAAPALKGLVAYRGEVASFTDCRSGRTYPVAEEGEFEALAHAYLAAGKEPGAPVMVSFEGGIEERPATGGEDVPTAVVGRFVGVWPDQACEQALGDATLENTVWRIERLGDMAIPAETDGGPQLLLDAEEGRFNATVGCNRLIGGFEVEEGSLRFGAVAATMMACPPPLDAWERTLADVLARTASWRVEGEALELLDDGGAPLATFRAHYLY